MERILAQPQTGVFSVTERFRATTGTAATIYVSRSPTGSATANGPVWNLTADGKITVVDGVGNACDDVGGAPPCVEEDTGFRWVPGTWHEVRILVDVAAQTYRLFFDSAEYQAPDPLGFRGSPVALDALTYFPNTSPGGVAFDAIVVADEQGCTPDDSDADGEVDTTDGCPGSGAGDAVDSAGCSRSQFCAAVDATTRLGARFCKKVDWQNDEPLMESKDADCTIQKGDKGRADDKCVPR
jgi:hypothetical protein